MKSQKPANAQPPFLSEFQPLQALWNGRNAPYPSEQSARWALRKLREPLAESKAVAIHRNRIFVHPSRFAAVAEQKALDTFETRARQERNE